MTKLNIMFTASAWKEYTEWKKEDKKSIKKIDKLIDDTLRHPFEGIGKPEPLQAELSGYWSRRINTRDRMVYGVTENAIEILQLKYHYSK